MTTKPTKRPRRLPISRHYQVSFMHKDVVTHTITGSGFLLTGSKDGVLKFWKRTPVEVDEEKTAKSKEPTQPCLEFVKSYTAHAGPISALAMNTAGTTAASVDVHKVQFYNVQQFDVMSFWNCKEELSSAAVWIEKDFEDVLCVASASKVLVVSPLQNDLLQTIELHVQPITCVAWNGQCVLSTDTGGICELWKPDGESFLQDKKDWYILLKKKTHAVAVAVQKEYFALWGANDRIYILKHDTLICTLDERLSSYEKRLEEYKLDTIDFGQRRQASPVRQLVFSDTLLMIPSLLGIKVVDWQNGQILGIWGQEDASQVRFCSVCPCPGPAGVDKQLLLARGQSTSQSANDNSMHHPDALVVALAHEQRRLYCLSRIDEVDENRDVWNETPTQQESLETTTAPSAAKTASKAILRTTMGDIHIQLFPQVQKTVENFVGHAKSGYYNDVIFHRVIKGFMLQTGDPQGDGTGGESVWGGEFEDEFLPNLRHDRPFTVSMANAGPNTNGSQFFITTDACPWLDNKHSVFGRVVRGMDVCQSIESVKTNDQDKPLQDISILNIDVEWMNKMVCATCQLAIFSVVK